MALELTTVLSYCVTLRTDYFFFLTTLDSFSLTSHLMISVFHWLTALTDHS